LDPAVWSPDWRLLFLLDATGCKLHVVILEQFKMFFRFNVLFVKETIFPFIIFEKGFFSGVI
jgi:hypothetical protein